MKLSIVNGLAENMNPPSLYLAEYLSQTLGVQVTFIETSYPVRRQHLLDGSASLGFMCGLLYSEFKDKYAAPLEPLLAPVSLITADKTSAYFSYIIVRQDSPYQQFTDLKKSVFCINEPESFSGCQIMRYHLSKSATNGFFSRVIESGTHLQSIQQILARHADSAAIDHTLFEYWAKYNPLLAKQLRIIERLGPFPMPPLVISQHVPETVRQHIQNTLLTMPRNLLQPFDIYEFQKVSDQTYHPIRQAARIGQSVTLVEN